MRKLYKILVGKPEIWTLLVRPRIGWDNNITTNLKVVGCENVILISSKYNCVVWCVLCIARWKSNVVLETTASIIKVYEWVIRTGSLVGSWEPSGLTNIGEFLNHPSICQFLKRPYSINLVNQIMNFHEQPMVVAYEMYGLQHDTVVSLDVTSDLL